MKTLTAAIDTKTLKVGCVLLQAVYRGDREACYLFDTNRWATSPTDDMILVTDTVGNWKKVAQMSREMN